MSCHIRDSGGHYVFLWKKLEWKNSKKLQRLMNVVPSRESGGVIIFFSWKNFSQKLKCQEIELRVKLESEKCVARRDMIHSYFIFCKMNIEILSCRTLFCPLSPSHGRTEAWHACAAATSTAPQSSPDRALNRALIDLPQVAIDLSYIYMCVYLDIYISKWGFKRV
jgi:hypothetical protein